MTSAYEQFDRSQLTLRPLAQRRHLVRVEDVLALGDAPLPCDAPSLEPVADAVADSVQRGAAVVLLMGAHVIKQGLSRYVIDLIRRGWVSVVAVNGACAIHDYELARIGATSESVAETIRQGRFGLWSETGAINDVVREGDAASQGFGEALGRHVAESDLVNKDVSIFAAGWRYGVPVTVHLGIGYDIIHEHPNFDAAAAGRASYRDFLVLTRVMERLEGGVVLCYGTAVMGPEVYLKALSMVRNVAARQGRALRRFTAAVFDLVALNGDLTREAAKDTPEYYYRPYKTLLVRTVADGGTSHYIQGDHKATLPHLHRLLVARLDGPAGHGRGGDNVLAK
ncbi:MAG: hypothetical protein KGY99_09015 [Phycisphaerae bacterium]|nr:hypothetical protein [Phycisphaerae bacterium]